MPTLQTSFNPTTDTARVALGGALPGGFVAVGSFEHPDPVYPGSVVLFHGVRDLLYKRSNINPAVTASFPDNITDMASVKISLVQVTSIDLTVAGGNLAVAATRQTALTYAPTGAVNVGVTYESSNPAVATVSSTGLVTGVSAGTATIRAVTLDGKIADTVSITVA